MTKQRMRIFAISGSLRAASSNTALVRATAALAPEMAFILYEGLGSLPHFIPELDDAAPVVVQELRRLLQTVDGVLLCTPEYAHGMPGSLKNALDWVVSSGEFDRKPVIAISASPSAQGGEKALASLVQTLTVMGARIVTGGSLAVPFVRTKLDANGGIADPATAQALRTALDALARAIAEG